MTNKYPVAGRYKNVSEMVAERRRLEWCYAIDLRMAKGDSYHEAVSYLKANRAELFADVWGPDGSVFGRK